MIDKEAVHQETQQQPQEQVQLAQSQNRLSELLETVRHGQNWTPEQQEFARVYFEQMLHFDQEQVEQRSERMSSDARNERVIELTRRYRRRAPWRNAGHAPLAKAQWFVDKLCELYEQEHITVNIPSPEEVPSDLQACLGRWNSQTRTISARKVSVITILHEFAHVLGMGQREAIQWSNDIFFAVWPEKRSALVQDRVGGVWRKPDELDYRRVPLNEPMKQA